VRAAAELLPDEAEEPELLDDAGTPWGEGDEDDGEGNGDAVVAEDEE
jgi:hypothetical protein